MKKNIIVVLIYLVLLSNCSSKAVNNIDKPIKKNFTMFSVEVNQNQDKWNSPVAKEIERITGVRLDIEYANSVEAGKEKIQLMIASNIFPDLIHAKSNISELKSANSIVKLDEYIDKCENIKKFYGNDLKRLFWSLNDKSIYEIGGNVYSNENNLPNAGFQLQHAVVKELGYPKLKTVKDFENAIIQYKKKYPQIDGKETIGLSLCADDWRFMITISNPACYATGGSDDGEWFVDQNSYKVTRHNLRPQEKEYYRWLNHLNNIGILDKESFTQKYEQYLEKISSGRVLGLTDARWAIDNSVKKLIKENKLDRCYGYYPIQLDEKTKSAEFVSTGYMSGGGIVVTKNCNDIKGVMNFIDWMCTEEAQILNHWGVEGQHYNVINGKRVLKDEVLNMSTEDPNFSKITGIGAYGYPFPYYGNLKKSSNGQFYTPVDNNENIMKNQSKYEVEILNKYGVNTWKELFPKSSEFNTKSYGAMWGFNIENKEISLLEDQILKSGYIMLSQAILAQPSKFDEYYDKYVNQIKKIGVDKVTNEYEKMLKQRIELWK